MLCWPIAFLPDSTSFAALYLWNTLPGPILSNTCPSKHTSRPDIVSPPQPSKHTWTSSNQFQFQNILAHDLNNIFSDVDLQLWIKTALCIQVVVTRHTKEKLFWWIWCNERFQVQDIAATYISCILNHAFPFESSISVTQSFRHFQSEKTTIVKKRICGICRNLVYLNALLL